MIQRYVVSRTKISSSDDNDIGNSRRHLYDRNNNNAWETVRGLWKLTWRSPSSLWALGTWVIEYSACLFVGWSFVKEPSTRGRITTFILSSYLVFHQNVGIIRSLTTFFNMERGSAMNMQWDIVLHALPFSNFHFLRWCCCIAAADLFSTLVDYRTGNPFMSILTVTAHIVPY
jgi:hypothetical protein